MMHRKKLYLPSLNSVRIFLLVAVVMFNVHLASAYEANDLKSADTYYAQQSYQLALTEYGKFRQDKASDELTREVNFKWADCVVKAKDTTRQEEAQKQLQDLVDSKDHDRWWAEAGVTLASLYIERDPYGKNVEIKKMLDDARDYWAGSSDVTLARQRFIEVSFMLADFITTRWGWYSADIKPIRLGKEAIVPPDQPGNWPLQVLFEEILKVAKSDNDKARAHYSLGLTLSNNYTADPKIKEKAISHFQTIIDDFSESEWVDDSYYQMGLYYENQNDFVKAEEIYRKFIRSFPVGVSQWVNDAQRRLETIVNPQIGVSVGYTFVPDSQIQFAVNRRNIKEAQMTLYRLDLGKAMDMNVLSQDRSSGFNNYQDILRVLVEKGRYEALPVEMSWKVDFKDEGKHISYGENKGLAEWRTKDGDKDIDIKKGVLTSGAYLLMATTATGIKAYDLVLVTDLAIVSKLSKDAGLFFVFDAKTGKPVAGADVKFNYSYYDGQGHTLWEEGTGKTDNDGLLKAFLKNPDSNSYNQQHQIFAVAAAGEKQAFLQNSYYYYGNNSKGDWWLYAFSDRPAYRPGEAISLKGILRKYNGAIFATPAGMSVKGRIYDAQGNQVKEGNYTLNAFGSFDDTLTLDEKAVLGEYRLELYTSDSGTHLATSVLFRLEEYKLPEFNVTIQAQPKEDDSKAKGFRLGDSIHVSVDAQYYFGGPVASAQVEYLVYQSPHVHGYLPERPYPWYYEDAARYNPYYDNYYQMVLIKKEKITTDDKGQAYFVIDTSKDSATDLQYRVEVRVVDQSRREIVASNTIKVTKNAFFAFLQAKNNLYRPGDKAQVTIKTMTANDEPVSVEGKVSVLRNLWRDPVIANEKVTTPGGYTGQEMLTKFVKTNERGEAVFEFEPNDDGYYVVEFTGFDNGQEVKSQASVYVCSKTSKDIGYRYGGLQIITEKDTYQQGDTMRAMIVSDRPDTWVLLTSEADAIYDAELLHLEGSVKLVEIPVTEDFIPNVHLTALSADHYQLKMNSLEIIVPPVKKFLNVTITSDKKTYAPQEEGNFEVKVTDQDGNAADAQLTVGITDAAVYYIQNEYAPDIRQFFYGDKRALAIQTQASFYQRPYIQLVRSENNELAVGDELDRQKQNRRDEGFATGNTMAMDSLQAAGGARNGEMLDLKKEKSSLNAPASVAAKVDSDKDGSNFRARESEARKLEEKADSSGGKGGALAEAQVRTDFRSTVIWLPNLVTTQDGKANFQVKFPDSLTTWRATVRAFDANTAIGNITYEVKSKKEMIVRLQAPRFFTERDNVTVSAIVNNYSDQEQKVRVTLESTGINVTDAPVVNITVPAGGEKRVDWKAQAVKAGQAQITVKAQSSTLADAMSRSYPVIAHGIEKFLAQSVVLKNQDETEQVKEMTINIPKERIKESTALRINLSPSMAANLLDALPYLADYPYGCVEQTMSRFLPAVIVRKTLRDLGLSQQDVEAYISDVLKARGDPQGHPQTRTDTTYSQVDTMTKDGLKRLYDFQHSDGGWGWWKDGDSDRFMSAYVVWGLSLARDAGVEVNGQTLSRAVDFLQKNLVEEENDPDMLAWMLHALAQAKSSSGYEDKHRQRLWDMRDKLNPYSRALFALSEHRRGNDENSRILAQNLINGIDEDKANQTAHWGEAGINYRWSEGGVEATAFVVKALANIDPQSVYLDPAVKWLSLNRRGASWKNTRDTAIAILSLTDYLKATQELSPDYDYQIILNGQTVREGHVNAQNALSFGRIIDIPSENLKDGDNSLQIKIKGKGSLYASAYTKYFTLEEGIKSAGNEIFVSRKYFKQSVKETLLKGYTDDWAPLNDGDTLKSGDRVRVDVTMEAKNNYEYLISEDYKPAGLEAVALNSGSATAIALDRSGKETKEWVPVYQEFRDQKAAFFIAKLKQGKYILRYELRAEVPGEFHAMPNVAHAMYVPEIRANSDEMRVNVVD